MFLADIDRTRRLVTITVAGRVDPPEAKSALKRLQTLLSNVGPDFRLLTDLSEVESMPTTVAPYIGQIMDLCGEKGIKLVARVLPKTAKNDIGFAIMSHFHYGPDVRIVSCESVAEAEQLLAE